MSRTSVATISTAASANLANTRPHAPLSAPCDPVEQVHIRRNRPGKEVVHRRSGLGKDLLEALNRSLSVVGQDQIARWSEAMELPLVDEFLACLGKGERPTCRRAKPVSRRRVDEVVTDNPAVGAEIVVVTDRKLHAMA